MLKECVGLTDEGQKIGKKGIALRLQHVDVAGADTAEIDNGNLALIGATLAEEHLPGAKHVGERDAVGEVAPAAHAKLARIEVLQTDVPLETVHLRIARALRAEADHIAEGDRCPFCGPLL